MKEKTILSVGAVWLAIVVIGLIGWVMNIVKIIGTGFELSQWGGLEVARVIGVFLAPLGAVLGWF